MKGIGKILRYLKNYKKYAVLNTLFNTISLIFNVFSLGMVIPVLQVLIYSSPAQNASIIQKGEPAFHITSSTSVSDFLNYQMAILQQAHSIEFILLLICFAFILVMFLKNLFRYLAVYFMAPIRNGVVKDVRGELYDKILELPLSYLSAERKGDIMARMTNDITEIEWSVMQSLEMFTINPLTIIVYITVLVYTSFQLSLIIIVLFPITGWLIARIGRSLRRSSTNAKDKMGIIFSMIEETLGGIRIIKAFNAENVVKGKFHEENRLYTRIMNKVYRKTDLASPLTEFLISIVLSIVIFTGGKLVLDAHTLDGKWFIFYVVIFSQLLTPAKALTTAYLNVEKGLASLGRINKILHAEVTVNEMASPRPIKTFDREIEFHNVGFAYQRGDSGYALKNINLKIPKGKTIAIVGQSGSGKSTLVDMLPRFYDPTEGSLTIDGVALNELSISQLRNLMGIVTQDTVLFNDTVKNNIAFGMKDITDEQVIQAAKVAHAHEFISSMENGYETNIGDRGGKMSGGERQRMSLARAILKNPPILILDEATSALDTESERLVQDALTKLMTNRTSIVIAHRLSTIKNADEIIVMQKGNIVERGSHAALLAQNGVYRRLYDLQSFV